MEKKKKFKLGYLHKGVEFDSLETILRLYKTKKLTYETIFNEYIIKFSQEPEQIKERELAMKIYNTLKPFTEEEIRDKFSHDNDQLLVALSSLN